MELKVIKESVAVGEVIYDSVTELPIECDVLLPDYCPDMTKVLKCCATPVFTQTAVEGAALCIEGYVLLELYYRSDTMQVRCSEHKTNFSKKLELKCAPENPAVSVSGKVQYLNCKAASPRRADIRGAMQLSATVLAQKSESVVAHAQGGGIQLRKSAVEATCLVGAAERAFTVREDLELNSDKPAIGCILRKQVRAFVTDCKVISNKVIVKGELLISLFYLCAEASSPQSMEYNLPISQIIELPGVEEDCRCDVRLRVCGCELQPKSDLDGENTLLAAEVMLCAGAKAYRACSIAAVADAYSTTHEATFTERPLSALCLAATVHDEHHYQQQFELPEEVSTVLYLWCQPSFESAQPAGEQASLTGSLTLCMLALDHGNDPVYFEKTEQFVHMVELGAPCEKLLADITMQPLECGFSTVGSGSLEVRCTVKICGVLYNTTTCNVMGELSVDEAKPRKREENIALTIYFAQQGECVWDIAKRYRTSVAAVLEENSMEQEELPARTTLLIPLIV